MKRFIQYVKNAYFELVQKVSWPSWSQLQNSAIVVMIASLLFALVVLAMDVVFENVMKTIYSLLY
ncbi:MAG: preprotein translocase subunit SecE [Rikenellaceae bacterium]|nr:preprotein translocase subunit SecE [Rikenellaceae bacterium]